MDKKIAILGGSKDQLPMIKYAHDQGFYVIVVDGKADCPGRSVADSFIHLSISDSTLVSAALGCEEVDAISSMITEAGVVTIYESCRALGLPNPYSEKSAWATVSKGQMRSIFAAVHLENIPYLTPCCDDDLRSFSRKYSHSLVIKRSDMGGQRDLCRIANENQLETFLQKHGGARLKGFIAESFIPGDEINCVFIVHHGQVRDLILSDRLQDDKVFGVVKRHVFPSKYAKSHFVRISTYCQRIADALEIEHGVVFPQFIISHDNGDPHLLELGVRIPGGIMDRLFSYSVGINLVRFALDISLGKVGDYTDYVTQPTFPSVLVTFFSGLPGPLLPGKVARIEISDTYPLSSNVLEHDLFTQSFPNVEVFNLIDGGTRFYYCVTVGNSFDEANQAARNFYDNVDCKNFDGESMKMEYFDFNSYFLDARDDYGTPNN